MGLVLEFGEGLESGLEFDQDQELDQEMELDRYRVSRGPLGHDLHHSYQVSGCTASGTPLFHEWDTFQGWTHPTSSVHYHSSTAFWSTAANFGWRSARSTG